MSKPTTTTPPTLDERIADLTEQRDNIETHLRALLAERARLDDVMRHAHGDPGFMHWLKRKAREERTR